jgi:hypothetical protein
MRKIYGLTYHALPTKQHRTKHAIRTHTFKTNVTAEKVGPFHAIKDPIEDQVATFLQDVEKVMLSKCDEVFESFTHDFGNVCPQRDNKTSSAVKRREELGTPVVRAKTLPDLEVRARLAKCDLNIE